MENKRSFFIADAHCDTLTVLKNSSELYKGKNHLNLDMMMKYEKWVQVFAIWTSPKEPYKNILKNYDKALKILKKTVSENQEKIQIIYDSKSLENVLKSKRCGAVIGVEGGEIIDDDLKNIDRLFDDGVRVFTLTWNYNNKIGAGAGDENSDSGLTDFGRSVIRKLNEKKMIIDVSHAAESTFWDVISESACFVMASHSNSKVLCGNERNLTDEQFLEIVKKNGFVGVNFYPEFLTDSKRASVSDIIRHIEHFMSLGGENNIGLGSDFDGVDYLPNEIKNALDIYKISDELLRLNYSEGLVKKIMGENFYEFLGRCFE